MIRHWPYLTASGEKVRLGGLFPMRRGKNDARTALPQNCSRATLLASHRIVNYTSVPWDGTIWPSDPTDVLWEFGLANVQFN